MGRYRLTVLQLQRKLSRHRRLVAQLEAAHSTLRTRAAAVDLALRTVEALIDLGQRLGWPWDSVDSDSDDMPAWWNELRRMRTELEGLRRPGTPAADAANAAAAARAPSTAPPSEAEGGGEPGADTRVPPLLSSDADDDAGRGTSSQGGSSAMSPVPRPQQQHRAQQQPVAVQEGLPDHIPLGWSPADAAARAPEAAAAGDFTTQGLRKAMESYAMMAGTLLPRIRNAAPDAPSAAQRLEQGKARLHEIAALILMQQQLPGDVSPLSYILTRPVIAGAPAEPPPVEHWEWAVSQTNLKPSQEELLWELLALWKPRIARITTQMNEVLALCRDAPAGNPGQQAEAVAYLEALKQQYQVFCYIFVAACCCSVMDTEQFAAYFTSSMPWCPSLTGLHAVLERRRQTGAAVTAAQNGGSGSEAAATAGVAVAEAD